MALPYELHICKDLDFYIIYVLELMGCVSMGSTVEEIISNLFNEKEKWFTSAIEAGIKIPEPELKVIKKGKGKNVKGV